MIEFSFIQIIGFIFTIAGLMWGWAKLTFGQYDSKLSERFASRDNLLAERLKPLEEALKIMSEAERRQIESLHQLELKIAKDYQPKEDAIRLETITMARYDGLCIKLDQFINAAKTKDK